MGDFIGEFISIVNKIELFPGASPKGLEGLEAIKLGRVKASCSSERQHSSFQASQPSSRYCQNLLFRDHPFSQNL